MKRVPATRLLLALLCIQSLIPASAWAGPPVSLGVLEINATPPPVRTAQAFRHSPARPAVVLARLPATAHAPYLAHEQAVRESAEIQRAMAEHGVPREMIGPTLREIEERVRTSWAQVHRALERDAGSLSADGWLLLADLRTTQASERADGDVGAAEVDHWAGARLAYTQAAALGGMSDVGLFARYRVCEIELRVGDVASARTGIAVVIANTSSGAFHARALAFLAELDGAPASGPIFARALGEGADAELRAFINFGIMIEHRVDDPEAARNARVSVLGDGDDTRAAEAAPTVGELLVRTADPAGTSLPATLAPDRATRALVAAGEAALALGERSWAELALQAAVDRASNSASGVAAATRLATLRAETAAPPEPVARWLARQATRCHSGVRDTGYYDTYVRRRQGVIRVVARPRPGVSIGARDYERCIEGALPDLATIDRSTVYLATLRVR